LKEAAEFLSLSARFMGTFQKIKAHLQSVIVVTKSRWSAHLRSYAYSFTHISFVSLYVPALSLNCLIPGITRLVHTVSQNILTGQLWNSWHTWF